MALIAAAAAWNMLGGKVVGGSSVWLGILLLAPFGVLMGYGFLHRGPAAGAGGHADMLGGILVAMWNYMGWDNVSTVAGEVERPQRTYPAAMAGAVALGRAHLRAADRGRRDDGAPGRPLVYRRLGGCRARHGRQFGYGRGSRARDHDRGNDRRRGDAQCADDGAITPSGGAGRGRVPAQSPRAADPQHRRSVGRDFDLRHARGRSA